MVSITRPNFLIFIPVFVIYLLFACKTESFKRRLSYILLFIISIVPTVLAVFIINLTVGRDTVLLSWNGGINFYLGNNQYANGWSATSPELDVTWWGGYKDAIVIAERDIGQKLLPSQVSHYWFKRGFNYILSQPLDWTGLTLKKIYLLFNSFELSNNQSIQAFRLFSPLLRIPLVNFGLIIALAIWGLISLPRTRKKMIIYLFLISYACSIVVFFVTARYRMPLVPFLLLFASYTVFWILQKFRAREHTRIIPAVIIVIVVAIFVHTDFYSTHSTNYSKIYVSIGNRYFSSGDFSRAIEEYKEALTYDSENTDAMNALANTYMMLGQKINAMQLFRESLNIQKSVDAFCKLGLIHFQLGRLDSAQVCFEEAAQLDSTNPEVHYYRGIYYANSRQPKRAIEHFERSLYYYPDPQYLKSIHYNLGKLYLETGNTIEARKHLLQAGEDYKDVSKILKSLH